MAIDSGPSRDPAPLLEVVGTLLTFDGSGGGCCGGGGGGDSGVSWGPCTFTCGDQYTFALGGMVVVVAVVEELMVCVGTLHRYLW